MKKLVFLLLVFVSCVFAGMDLNTATKEELMSIKGIGPKKALQIMEYRTKNTIKSADDLSSLKGFGPGIIDNIKKGVKVSKEKKMRQENTNKKQKQ